MRIVLAGMAFLAVACSALADDPKQEFFEKKIRPLLVTHCYECHSSESKKLGGELLLDSRDGLRKGGESGSAIHEGQPDGSLLIKAVRYSDDSLKMPPKGRLPETAIADLETWIRQGAFDPREQSPRSQSAPSWREQMKERSVWWSLLPVHAPTLPAVTDPRKIDSPVDQFVLARLKERGLDPAPAADPRSLARRLCLTLTGLAPDVEQVDRFEAACRSAATSGAISNEVVEKFVDSLLDSPHYGEHWARHWMDVIRFSETHGNEWNYEVHHAWRYRDYLIRAFNADVPYDQFIREHIAGDLLPEPRWNRREQFNESVIGTGFYRFGEVNHDDCITLRSLGYDLADNQIDTLTKAFLATTVACARCHNHKLDAISSEDYYALLGVIRSSRNVSHCIDAPEVNAELKRRMREIKDELRRELGGVWRTEAAQLSRYMQAAQAIWATQIGAEESSKGLDPSRLNKWVETLKAEKQPLEEPFQIWRQMSAAVARMAADKADRPNNAVSEPARAWQELTQQITKRYLDDAGSDYHTFADFRTYRSTRADHSDEFDQTSAWARNGQGLTEESSLSGDFIIHTESDSIVEAILPTGLFTHTISSKLNGTLRSPVLPAGMRYISFQVMGQRSSAVRLVSNNCQLNYSNYQALTSPELRWIRFTIPQDRESLRTYAELMTMFDNPKFPDQLSALGGDPANYKVPWEKAAENPRSYFGVTRVVLHDQPAVPAARISYLMSVVDSDSKTVSSDSPNSTPDNSASNNKAAAGTTVGGATELMEEVIQRYARRMEAAIVAWSNDQTTDDDVVWLDAMVRRGLLNNSRGQSPRCQSLVDEFRRLEAELALPRVCVGVSDGGPGINQPVFIRGDCNRPGEKVPRRFLEVLSKSNEPFRSPNSGRLELAHRIASPENPLTARVMVNRVWHHLFGTGLVKTVDDFGHVGETPSHPELLDYLAIQFVNDGWSVKRLIRSLVLSRTFQRSNRASEISQNVDPQNRLLQHYPARRMEAEQVRDAILQASGRLDATLFGMSVQPFREKEYADRRLFPGPLDGAGRRSIYIKNNLMETPKFLGAFNFPGGKVAQGRRDVTNVPAQALALLNDPFVVQQADVWSQKLISRTGDSLATRLDAMFRSALSRSPTAEELARFEATILQLAELHQIPAGDLMTSQVLWKDVAHSLFNLSEFLFIP